MHGISSRLNALFAFFLSVMGAIAFGCFASTVCKDYSTGSIEVAKHDITLLVSCPWESDLKNYLLPFLSSFCQILQYFFITVCKSIHFKTTFIDELICAHGAEGTCQLISSYVPIVQSVSVKLNGKKIQR